MRREVFLLLGMITAFSSCQNISLERPDNILYQGQDYTVYKDRVTQGKFVGEAQSPTRITSDYQSPANAAYPRHIEFKFSLNGKDNEMAPGINHHLVLKPEGGRVVSPVMTFGVPDKETPDDTDAGYLEPNTELVIRVDMSPVMEDFAELGYYEDYNGNKLAAEDFRGVYVAGNADPLSWDFENLPYRPQFELKDPDRDGIYEVSLLLNAYDRDNFTDKEWQLSKDLSALPAYESSQPLADALYNMALEEMLLNIREDSTFMAGEKWEGVWTRDISYSIVLSLAMIAPEIARNSLMHKVKDGRIIQDTGTGGSWPVSTDRMTWAMAAYEVYLATGDTNWLEDAYTIIKNSAEDDLKVIFDERYGMVRGESSFLDWRKQSYPQWMNPVDIYESLNLGTNAVHYRTYRILEEMALALNEDATPYEKTAADIKKGVNRHLWMEDKGYYGQYLYGKHFLTRSPRSESLGEALTVLYGIAGEERGSRVIENMPVVNYGVPSIYPQIPGVPPYHNDAIWPFVQAYYTWAAAKTGNTEAVSFGMGGIYRHAAFFLTNKENLTAHSGDYRGTELNSNRQLWSVAGNLAMIYRIIYGMELKAEGLYLRPFVPINYGGNRRLTNFPYRNARLNITMTGYGNKIASFKVDGKEQEKHFIAADLEGSHEVEIVLKNNRLPSSKINLTKNAYSPGAPRLKANDDKVTWEGDASVYHVIRNGNVVESLKGNDWTMLNSDEYREIGVTGTDGEGLQGFTEEPLRIFSEKKAILIEAETQGVTHTGNVRNHTGSGYREISLEKNTSLDYSLHIDQPGIYLLEIRYSNGSGPVNTDNKCAIRSLYVDGAYKAAMVFPQLEMEEWSTWAYSNKVALELTEGMHTIMLRVEGHNRNMNGEVNRAFLDHLRLIPLDR